MHNFFNLPFELRLKVYKEYLGDIQLKVHLCSEGDLCRVASPSKLFTILSGCKAIKDEIEPIYRNIIQLNPAPCACLLLGGFNLADIIIRSLCPGFAADSEWVVKEFESQQFKLFGLVERRPLRDFMSDENLQMLLHRTFTKAPQCGLRRPPMFQILGFKFDRFIITGTIAPYTPRGNHQAAYLMQLLHFCHGRVQEVHFQLKASALLRPVNVVADINTNMSITANHLGQLEAIKDVLLSQIDSYNESVFYPFVNVKTIKLTLVPTQEAISMQNTLAQTEADSTPAQLEEAGRKSCYDRTGAIKIISSNFEEQQSYERLVHMLEGSSSLLRHDNSAHEWMWLQRIECHYSQATVP